MQFLVDRILAPGDISSHLRNWGLKSPLFTPRVEATPKVILTELGAGEIRIDITEDHVPALKYMGPAQKEQKGDSFEYVVPFSGNNLSLLVTHGI